MRKILKNWLGGCFILSFILVNLSLASSALAPDLWLLVVVENPQGIAIYDQPEGKLNYVQAQQHENLRRVKFLEQQGAWVLVQLANAKTGWIPSSSLGGYAGQHQNGPCGASRLPQASPSLKLPQDQVLHFVQLDHSLLQMRWQDQDQQVLGWLPILCLKVDNN